MPAAFARTFPGNRPLAAVHPLRRLLGFARPYRRDAALGTLFSVLNKIFDVLPELLIGVAVDVVVNQKASFLARAGIVRPDRAAVPAGGADGRGVGVRIAVRVPVRAALARPGAGPAARAAQCRLRAPAGAAADTIARERSGRLLALLNEDVNQIERFLNTGANDLIQVFVSSLLVGAVFFVMTASLAALALLPIPLILVGAFWFQRRLYPRYFGRSARRRRRSRPG
jgi:ATP-binding cassette subfamily B protein